MTETAITYPSCPIHKVPLVLKASRFGPFLGCQRFPDCDITHSVHKASLQPMGTPADQATRRARMRVHAAFDTFWRERVMTRRDAYRWLANQLGLSEDECHIGLFDLKACEEALTVIQRMGVKDGE